MATNWPAHPRLLTALAAAFPERCTIQAPSNTNTEGSVLPGPWNAVAGCSDIPCRVSPVTGRAVHEDGLTYAEVTEVITLAGRYEGIAPHMQAVIGARAYEIQAVAGDGSGVMTRLHVRRVA